ncbi:MAG TPA: two-component regulator propeller domain-containing protein [Bryobacteraceae bacterium]|nr:two-component regulator propeller domain-containing protein [Bryobacteraceae bacterium]
MWPKLAAGCLLALLPALALNPRRGLTQYTRTDWTQEHGLPQDTIRTITQTKDGYLWLGTDEGLAQFDGYDFVVFNKENGSLPSNTVSALCAASDGSLWIGTPGGLTLYRDGKFTTYTKKDGLPDTFINSLAEDRSGAVWIVAGSFLSRFQNGRFTNYSAREGLPIESMRAVHLGRDGSLYVAGFSGIARREGDTFVPVIDRAALGGDIVSVFTEDRQGNLWVARASGLLMRAPSGKLRLYRTQDGLPDNFVRSLWEDRDGNLWAGTNGGLARFENGRFVTNPLASSHERDWVRCLFEDAQGNLWVGMNNGLSRFRDDRFTVYGESEGLPSDEPNTVYQDRSGRIWVGLHDGGLVQLGNGKPRVYTTRDGLPSNEVFSIREDHRGDLLLATRAGPSRMHDGRFTNVALADPMHRRLVFDFLEDRNGRFWIASPAGLLELQGSRARNATPSGVLLNNAVVDLCETRDGSLWAGSYGQGLWHIDGEKQRLYTTADGLSSDQIRSVVEDADGTLWIGTFGGGLNALRAGRFFSVATKEGLLSDNIAHVEDDGRGSLWLSTTRGICQVRKSELNDFARGKLRSVTPVNYGVADGLRSAQCAPGFPTSRGGTQSKDGRLWFPTSRGLAVLDPNEAAPSLSVPVVHLLDMQVDGRAVALGASVELPPGSDRVQFRYTGLELGAPERVRYSYRLEGLDRDWVNAGTRRVANYNSLPHNRYRFVVRATIPGGSSGETSFAFRLLPQFYETAWFRYLCVLAAAAGIWGLFRLRVRQIRQRFALVLDERARLAREIHDTLAQGFVGISSQLDAVALTLNGHLDTARQHLNLARKMARHSLTEARRSVMDLRASALEGHDLQTAISQAARQWTAGSAVQVEVDIAGKSRKLPEEMEQHLLRIAQEAVTNTVKHAHAHKVRIGLEMDNGRLRMQVTDDGEGFEQTGAFSEIDGHFGLLGMRERAQRLGGELQLASKPGQGTKVEVTVPLS